MPIVFIYYLIIFIFGLFLGSFLNVIADRIINGKNIVFDRSACDFCNTKLTVVDLIPVFSYLFSRGSCRHCSKKISAWYPVSELFTALVVVYMVYASGVLNILLSPTPLLSVNYLVMLYAVFLILIGIVYVILFLTDAKYGYLPNKIVYPAIVLTVIYNLGTFALVLLNIRQALEQSVLGKYLLEVGMFELQASRVTSQYLYTFVSALLICFFFYLLTKIKDGHSMGCGDVKLALLSGLVHTFPKNVLAIFLGFLFGAVYSLFFIAVGRKKMADTIPFGPFLILGSLVVFEFGDLLLNYYLNYFNY